MVHILGHHQASGMELNASCPTFLMVIMQMSKPWQVVRFTGKHTETRDTSCPSPSQKDTFFVVYLGAVCTAEPVENYLKVCSNQGTTAVFVYNTGRSKTFSSSTISKKVKNSGMSDFINSDETLDAGSVHVNSQAGICNRFRFLIRLKKFCFCKHS